MFGHLLDRGYAGSWGSLLYLLGKRGGEDRITGEERGIRLVGQAF